MSTEFIRCSSCGYVQPAVKVDRVTHADTNPVVPPTAPVVVSPVPVVQLSVCPLCRTEYAFPADYAAHRERNCAALPDAPAPAPEPQPDPVIPEPAPAPEPQPDPAPQPEV